MNNYLFNYSIFKEKGTFLGFEKRKWVGGWKSVYSHAKSGKLGQACSSNSKLGVGALQGWLGDCW